MISGYIKIYSGETDDFIEQQREALLKAGADRIIIDSAVQQGLADIYQEQESSFIKTINSMSKEDSLIIYSLDRLGLFLSDIFSSIEKLTNKNINWQSLTEEINSKDKNYGSAFWYRLFKLLIQYEKSARSKSTVIGLNSAKKRGIKLGKPTIITEDIVEQIRKRIARGESHVSIISSLEMNKMTFYRALKKFNIVKN
jgi:DNA invertase Pin-like site-specific DNA recombinase